MANAFKITNNTPMPGAFCMNTSNNKIFREIGAINRSDNALVDGTSINTASMISRLFTRARKPVVYKSPAKTPALPGTEAGIGIKCKKKLDPNTRNMSDSK
jgi:hypothetical protein